MTHRDWAQAQAGTVMIEGAARAPGPWAQGRRLLRDRDCDWGAGSRAESGTN